MFLDVPLRGVAREPGILKSADSSPLERVQRARANWRRFEDEHPLPQALMDLVRKTAWCSPFLHPQNWFMDRGAPGARGIGRWVVEDGQLQHLTAAAVLIPKVV